MLSGSLVITLLFAIGSSALKAQQLQLNFEGADIRALVTYVAEQTGRNFIVDPRVRGEVTVVSGGVIDEDKLYAVFLEILQIQGFAAVEGETAIRIVPEAFAKQFGRATEATGAGDYETRFISVDHVDVQDIVPLLRPLMPQNAHLAASPGFSLLLMADSLGNVERLEAIIRQIDQRGSQEISLIPLEHADADKVAALMESILSTRGGAGPNVGAPRVIADPRTNTLVVSGNIDGISRIEGLVSQLDEPVESGNTEVIHLRYAEADAVSQMIRELMATPRSDDQTANVDSMAIRAHAATNSVVIQGSSEQLAEVRAITEKIDIRQPQVLVEAVIAEVSVEYARQLGVQWAAGSPTSGVGILNFGMAQTSLASLARGISAGNLAEVDLGSGLSLAGLGELGGSDFAILIEALATDSANNILSTPSILTLANEEASITVGQNVPFRSGRAIEDSGQAFDTIERRDVGVQLNVRPQINDGDVVRLNIRQEVSNLAPTIQNAADLITNKRSLSTSVIVDNNEVVVLGGLLDDVQTQRQERVPGLAEIPFFGSLFRYERTTTEQVNLMVFLRPMIIRSAADQLDVSSNQYRRSSRQMMNTWEELGLEDRQLESIDAALDPFRVPPPFGQVAAPPAN